MKQYIKDLQMNEVIARLKQGEQLVNDNGYVFEMIEGVVCCHNNQDYYINVSIAQGDNFYFERPEPELGIEVGKFYITRDGRKAYVFNINLEGKYCVVTNNKMPYVVSQGGYFSDEKESGIDLVAPYGSRKGQGRDTDRYETLKKLLQQGLRKCEICKELNLSYAQVDQYIRSHDELKQIYKEKNAKRIRRTVG